MGRFEDFQEGYTGMSAAELKAQKIKDDKKKKGWLNKLFDRTPSESKPEEKKEDKKKYGKTKAMLYRG